MSKNKQMILLSYELLEAGGINRLVNGFQTGFRKLGYDVITYLVSNNGRLTIDNSEYTLQTKWFRPPSINLGWNNAEQLKNYRNQLKNSDFVLSLHGAPHPTKSGAKGDYGWHRIYEIPKKLNVPVGIMFTDNMWHRLYKWIEDVIDENVRLFYCNYNAKYDSMSKLKYDSIFIDYPIDFDEQVRMVKNRKIDVAWMPQFKKWKGIYEFVNQLSNYPNSFYTVLFNSGIEYYNLRKENVWAKAIRYENRPRIGKERNTANYYEKILHNKKSTTDYFGLLYPDQVNKVYANSKVCLDLSGAYSQRFEGQFTCAMAEPMLHKSVVAVSPHLNESKKSRIYGMNLVYSVDPNAIIDSLDELIGNDKMRGIIASNAYKWLKNNCRDSSVSAKIAKYMES